MINLNNYNCFFSDLLLFLVAMGLVVMGLVAMGMVVMGMVARQRNRDSLYLSISVHLENLLSASMTNCIIFSDVDLTRDYTSSIEYRL